jgi:hypothetical protein
MDENLLDKVRKLLRLAERTTNEGEAAAAAGAAQRLIERHRLDVASIDLGEAHEAPVEAPEQTVLDGAEGRRNKCAWRGSLASGVARANACRVYWTGPRLQIVGAPSDVATVRYLYAYLVREIDRIADTKSGGKAWLHAWRMGAVSTVSQRLREAREEARREARAEAQASGGAGGAAIVRVNAGIARIERAESAVEAVMAAMKMRKGKPTKVRAWGAYEQGRADGATIRIAAGAALGTGAAGRING